MHACKHARQCERGFIHLAYSCTVFSKNNVVLKMEIRCKYTKKKSAQCEKYHLNKKAFPPTERN